MTSKYAKQLDIPSDFPNVLRDLSREILRAVMYESIQGTEEEILAFASKHFKKMARQGRDTRFNRRKIMNAAMELYLHESIQLEQDEYGAMMGAVNVNTNSNTTSKEDNLVASDQTVEDGDSGICDKEQSRGNIHPVEGVEEVQVASELEPELLTTPIAVSNSCL